MTIIRLSSPKIIFGEELEEGAEGNFIRIAYAPSSSSSP